MTHVLVSIALFLATALTVAFVPPVKAVAGVLATRVQRALFTLLVVVLWAFSMHDLTSESGLLYGMAFSLVPLIAGGVVLCLMRRSKA